MRKTRRNSPPLTESEKRGFKDTNGKIVQAFGGDATRQSTKFAPQSPKQAKKEKEIMASQKRRLNQNKIRRVTNAITTGGVSEIARKITQSNKVRNLSKTVANDVKRTMKRTFNKGRDIGKKVNKFLGNEGGLISAFKMKGFGGFGNESPAKMKGVPKGSLTTQQFNPSSGKFQKIGDRISKKPANAAQKSFRNFKNAATPNPRGKMATGKIGRKVAGKLGGKLLGPVGVGLAVKDAYGTYKDIKKGMKPGKAARKNFLGF